jgi:hypothetical protein
VPSTSCEVSRTSSTCISSPRIPRTSSLPSARSPSSPARALGRFELARYLDYCSEALSITSKLAALYAQYFNDPVVLGAVNDVETLAQGFSVKIWQKIMILDTISVGAQPGE